MAKGETYEEFVEKFKPKLTTDDCYTPANIYDAVADWVCGRYGVDRGCFVRPFFPGGDYENHEYPPDCVVVDNPPFSIINKICRFYMERGIRFFLFAPALTLFGLRSAGDMRFIVTDADVIYANGANVKTSFVTNLERGGFSLCPDLRKPIEAANTENIQASKKQTKSHIFPMNVVSSALLGKIVKRGVELSVDSDEYVFIRKLDSGQHIFGGGFLLSERAAAERAAAERAAAERAAAERAAAERAAAERAAAERAAAAVHQLSEREWGIVRGLSKNNGG